MLSPRRSCLDCSKVCCDVREIWFMAWNQNTYVTYYILHIQYTNSEISIGLLYIHPPRPRPPHPSFDGSNLIIVIRLCPVIFPLPFWSVPLGAFLTFHTHTSTILAPLGFTNSRSSDFRVFPFPHCLVLRTRLAWHGRSYRTTSKVLSTSFKK